MNITIRPLEENDAQTSVKWRNTPEIWKLTGSKPDHTITIEEELEWIRRVIQDKTCRRFAILADGRYIGNTYLTDMHKGEAEFHIFIGDKSYWGKGIAKRASILVIEYAKNELNLMKINLGVNPENLPAISIYRALGFKEFDKKDGFVRMSLSLTSS